MSTENGELPQSLASRRRYDVDHLRVIALFFLILFHVGLVFANFGWIVQSQHTSIYVEAFISGLLAPWRLLLVFFIGGVAARYAIGRASFSNFFKARVARLLVPFVFGVVVLVPPQGYADNATGPLSVSGYLHYLTHVALIRFEYHGIRIPDFAHVWFLPYLFTYSIAAAAIWTWLPKKRTESISNGLSFALVCAAAILYFIVNYALILPFGGDTKIIFSDWSGNLLFGPAFALGFLFATNASFWEGAKSHWRRLAGVAIMAGAIIITLNLTHPSNMHPFEAGGVLLNAAKGLYGGTVLFALLGFAFEKLNAPSPGLSYASDAILPVYLMHQTVTVLAGYYIIAQNWSGGVQFIALLLLTLGVPLVIYQFLVRNNRVLRVLFGLRPSLQRKTPRVAQTPFGQQA